MSGKNEERESSGNNNLEEMKAENLGEENRQIKDIRQLRSEIAATIIEIHV